ncbi:MAG TPA: D-alanine--D-alanine ligase family protein [Actinomycetota bacterium]|nr:D-alanine--D-alanine ligase family protein [Actinomycetota bacterium]
MSRVGVIFGGRSVEHDVSIVTAHQLMAVLRERHEVVPVYVARDGRWFTGPVLDDLEVYRAQRWEEAGDEAVLPPTHGYGGLQVSGGRLKGTKKVPLDVVVPAIHGTFGEDGTLQGLLELAGLPYTGSGVAASAVGMDKVAMKRAFAAAGVPVVEDVLIDLERRDALTAGLDEVEATLGYPAFVKPVKAGSSVGIGKARGRDELGELIEVAARYDTRVLVENAVEGCIEINCSVIGGGGREPRVSVCEQPLAWQEFLSFEDKYMRGGKGSSDAPRGGAKTEGMASLDRRIPAPISEESTKQIQENARAAFEAVGAAGVARVDAFLNEETGQTWVMEINTVPGSFAFYLWEASGLGFPDLAEEMLAIAFDRHRALSDRLFTFESGMLEAKGGKSGG